MADPDIVRVMLQAVRFAADRHRHQKRKDERASPYINHPIAVAETLTEHGVRDPVTLLAAVLHDTLEDTDTEPEELETRFGPEVRRVVEEVTDDKDLPKPVRKQRQVERAPRLSSRAKIVKLADKISNVRDVVYAPPVGWSIARRAEYLNWTREVVAGCRGTNEDLERTYDELLEEGFSALEREAGREL